ncbi:MAG TPA: hypothetical protein VFV63_17510 [Ilumatobacteraceae bacterium]|nr:hypothetical protein [Ilumatobacteraceae bacterium]
MSLIVRWRLLSVLLVMGATACGDPEPEPEASSAETAPASSTSETTATDNGPTRSVIETTTLPAPPDITTTVPGPIAAIDRAEVYLGATTEVYRRTLPDGQDFVVRLSTESYAAVFGLSWTAPTGSAEQCLGDHAAFLGVPGDIGSWGSAWVAAPWSDTADPTQPAVLQSSMRAAEDTVPATQFLVVRTAADAAEVVLLSGGGSELDRAPVANGVAMVMLDPQTQDEGQTVTMLRVVTVATDGQHSAPSPLMPLPPGSSGQSDCGPGPPPQRPIPAAGVQPTDPAAAEAQIRQRHALLVDRSVPADHKPNDLLDDDTGVQTAIASLDDGPYRDVAASASYAIDELVFTTPDEAWFRYTITTSSATYTDRFGTAVFNGDVWQITRATICQDLALALSPCLPNPPTVEPPSTPAWETAWQEWISRAMLYTGNDGCAPLSQC